MTQIQKWALAIQICEGAQPELCNPGNLKLTTLTQSWGASAGFDATDGGVIAKFPTYEIGLQALEDFLQLGCENELLAFHSPAARTLGGFTAIYAGDPPANYLNTVCMILQATPETQISTFIEKVA